MKTYSGTFLKKNGEERTMLFAYLEDLPSDYLANRIIGGSNEKTYPEGMKLVWDLEADNFRVFNFNKVIGKINEIN